MNPLLRPGMYRYQSTHSGVCIIDGSGTKHMSYSFAWFHRRASVKITRGEDVFTVKGKHSAGKNTIYFKERDICYNQQSMLSLSGEIVSTQGCDRHKVIASEYNREIHLVSDNEIISSIIKFNSGKTTIEVLCPNDDNAMLCFVSIGAFVVNSGI